MPPISLPLQVKLFVLLSIVIILALNHPFVENQAGSSRIKRREFFKRQLTTGVPPATSNRPPTAVPQTTSIVIVQTSSVVIPPVVPSSVVPPPVAPSPIITSSSQPIQPRTSSQVIPRSTSSLPLSTTGKATQSNGFYEEISTPIEANGSYNYIPIQSSAQLSKSVSQVVSILLLTIVFNRMLAYLI
jgi:hypothetical protein